MDPPGVGARSLQECLLLQLSRSGKDSEYSVAINIVSNFFNDFKKRHFAKIKERLNVNSDVLDKAINLGFDYLSTAKEQDNELCRQDAEEH